MECEYEFDFWVIEHVTTVGRLVENSTELNKYSLKLFQHCIIFVPVMSARALRKKHQIFREKTLGNIKSTKLGCVSKFTAETSMKSGEIGLKTFFLIHQFFSTFYFVDFGEDIRFHLKIIIFSTYFAEEISVDLFFVIISFSNLFFSIFVWSTLNFNQKHQQIITFTRFAPESRLHQISINNIRSDVKTSTLASLFYTKNFCI